MLHSPSFFWTSHVVTVERIHYCGSPRLSSCFYMTPDVPFSGETLNIPPPNFLKGRDNGQDYFVLALRSYHDIMQ